MKFSYKKILLLALTFANLTGVSSFAYIDYVSNDMSTGTWRVEVTDIDLSYDNNWIYLNTTAYSGGQPIPVSFAYDKHGVLYTTLSGDSQTKVSYYDVHHPNNGDVWMKMFRKVMRVNGWE